MPGKAFLIHNKFECSYQMSHNKDVKQGGNLLINNLKYIILQNFNWTGITHKIFEKTQKIIIEQAGGIVETPSNLSRVKMRKMKNKKCPKTDGNYPIAKMNTNGDLIKNKSELKSLYIKT